MAVAVLHGPMLQPDVPLCVRSHTGTDRQQQKACQRHRLQRLQGPRRGRPNSGNARDLSNGVNKSPAAKPPTWAHQATPGCSGLLKDALISCSTNQKLTTQKALSAKG